MILHAHDEVAHLAFLPLVRPCGSDLVCPARLIVGGGDVGILIDHALEDHGVTGGKDVVQLSAQGFDFLLHAAVALFGVLHLHLFGRGLDVELIQVFSHALIERGVEFGDFGCGHGMFSLFFEVDDERFRLAPSFRRAASTRADRRGCPAHRVHPVCPVLPAPVRVRADSRGRAERGGKSRPCSECPPRCPRA